MWTRILVVIALAGATLVGGPGAAVASHYELADVDFVPEAEQKRLAKVGVTSTKDIIEKAGGKKARRKIARRARIKIRVLTEWVYFCDLLRVQGVGPTMAALLQASGVRDIAALQKEEAGPLLTRATEVNREQRITTLMPAADQLRHWIEQARAMPILVK